MKHTTIALILLIISQLSHSQQIIIHNDNEGMLYQNNELDYYCQDCDSTVTRPYFYLVNCGCVYVNKCDSITHERMFQECVNLNIEPVVMLVCDTSNVNARMAGQLPFYSQDIFWIKGYEVKEYIPAKYDKNDLLLFQHWETIEYLDENKKPLSKNIVVWMTK